MRKLLQQLLPLCCCLPVGRVRLQSHSVAAVEAVEVEVRTRATTMHHHSVKGPSLCGSR